MSSHIEAWPNRATWPLPCGVVWLLRKDMARLKSARLLMCARCFDVTGAPRENKSAAFSLNSIWKNSPTSDQANHLSFNMDKFSWSAPRNARSSGDPCRRTKEEKGVWGFLVFGKETSFFLASSSSTSGSSTTTTTSSSTS